CFPQLLGCGDRAFPIREVSDLDPAFTIRALGFGGLAYRPIWIARPSGADESFRPRPKDVLPIAAENHDTVLECAFEGPPTIRGIGPYLPPDLFARKIAVQTAATGAFERHPVLANRAA